MSEDTIVERIRNNPGFPVLVGWFPMRTAPMDREILVWAPGRDGLGDMFSPCHWHPDAGFCIDELREPTCWIEYPAQIWVVELDDQSQGDRTASVSDQRELETK